MSGPTFVVLTFLVAIAATAVLVVLRFWLVTW